MSNATILQCENLVRSFDDGTISAEVLNGVDLSVSRGEQIAIVGASGSGKSTLLHCLGGLDSPTSGNIRLFDQDLTRLSDNRRGVLRNKHMGFIYQFHHLLPEFSAQENVAFPLIIRGEEADKAMQNSADMLAQVNLQHRLQHKPSELSGGERQRAAIARALVNQPDIVLADEPTGNLDTHTASQVYELMLSINRARGTSYIIVTHDERLAARMDRVFHLNEGRLTEQV